MLTKSDFKIFIQTPLHYWAKKHDQYNDMTTDFNLHLSKNGYEVEDYAKEYVRKNISADFTYQREFTYGELSARSDIVIYNNDTQKFDIYEIKASTEIKQEFEFDIAFQYYVASQTENIGETYLIFLDKEYIRSDTLDVNGLFRIVSMQEAVLSRLEEVKDLIKEALRIADQPYPTNIQGCYRPQKCPCPHLCFPNKPENSIYELVNLNPNKADELKNLGVISMVDIPGNFDLGRRQKLQLQSLKENKPIINKERIMKELSTFKFPLYFLDYETYSWAIPRYKNHRVYQNVVFQFSLNILTDINEIPLHYEYLSNNKEDVTRELIANLLENIGTQGTVLAWNKEFEKGCNREMARLYPEFKDRLMNINERIYDLGEIFNKHFYVDYRFKGSWSIKNVLPVLVPELNYKDMEISNGTMAMTNWEQLVFGDLNSNDHDRLRYNLLRYCELDTLAMVKIYQNLHSL